MPDVVLEAQTRPERGSRPAGRLRRSGLVPAVVYGLDDHSVAVTVPAREVDHILRSESGANTVVTLRVGGTEQLTLPRQIQRDPVRGDLIHIDFVRVRADVAVAAEVPLHLLGEPEGVRNGGLLEQLIFSLSVEAKPADIPSSVEADVAALGIGDQIRVADLMVPPGVELQHEPDALVAQVVAPRVAEEDEVAAEGEEGEVAEGAAEGAEGAETAEGGDSESDSGGE